MSSDWVVGGKTCFAIVVCGVHMCAYIYIHLLYVHKPESTRNIYGLDLLLLPWRFQDNSSKDTLDSEMVVNDEEEISCRFICPSWIYTHHLWLIAVWEWGKVAGVLFWQFMDML